MSLSSKPMCLALVAIVAVLAAGLQPASAQACSSVYQTVASNPDFSTLKGAIDATGLKDVLSDPTLTYTLFAPSDRAFRLASSATGGQLGDLKALLQYHIVPGVAITKAAGLASDGAKLPTLLANRFITVNVANIKIGSVTFPQLTLVPDTGLGEGAAPAVSDVAGEFDITACKAIIHTIEFVIIPTKPTVSATNPATTTPVTTTPATTTPAVTTPATGVVYGFWNSLPESLANIPELSVVKSWLEQQVWYVSPNTPWSTVSATYYLPTNSAINAFLSNPAATCSVYATVPLNMDTFLRQHVVIGEARISAALVDGFVANTFSGRPITVYTPESANFRVSGPGNTSPARVINANNGAGRAVLHIIDKVLCY